MLSKIIKYAATIAAASFALPTSAAEADPDYYTKQNMLWMGTVNGVALSDDCQLYSEGSIDSVPKAIISLGKAKLKFVSNDRRVVVIEATRPDKRGIFYDIHSATKEGCDATRFEIIMFVKWGEKALEAAYGSYRATPLPLPSGYKPSDCARAGSDAEKLVCGLLPVVSPQFSPNFNCDSARTDTDRLICTLLSYSPPEPSQVKPSFDCFKARSDAEKLICADSQLSALDADYEASYKRTRLVVTDASALKNQSIAEWKWREANCKNKACLIGWYEKRQAQLKEWALPGSR